MIEKTQITDKGELKIIVASPEELASYNWKSLGSHNGSRYFYVNHQEYKVNIMLGMERHDGSKIDVAIIIE